MSEITFEPGAIRRSAAALTAVADTIRHDADRDLVEEDAVVPVPGNHLAKPRAERNAVVPLLRDAIGEAVVGQRRVADELDDAAREFAGVADRAEELAVGLGGDRATGRAGESHGASLENTPQTPFARVPSGPWSDDLAEEIARLRRAWRDSPAEVRRLFDPQAFLNELDDLAGEVGPFVADSARLRATELSLLELADAVEAEAASLSRTWEGYAALVMRSTLRKLAARQRHGADDVSGLAARHEILVSRIREQRDVVAGQCVRIARAMEQASGAAHTGHPAALKLWVFVRGDRAIRDVLELRAAVLAHGNACGDLAEFYHRCRGREGQ